MDPPIANTESLPHIFLLGATGRTGRLLITEAAARGFTLAALARDPSKLSDLKDEQQITIAKGDPTSPTDLLNALEQSLQQGRKLVIVSTLGQTRTSGNPWAATTSPPLFMSQAITALFTAIKQLSDPSRIQKLVIMSMFGTGVSFQNLHCAIRPVMRHSNMLQTLEDHNAVDEVVKGQREVKWTMVRPTMLKEGSKMDVVVRDDDGVGEGWLPSSITSASVVDFMLRSVMSEEWDGRTPVIVN